MPFVATLKTAVFLAGRSIWRGNIGVLLTTIAMMSLIYVQLLFIPALIEGAVVNIQNQLVDTTTADLTITPPEGELVFADADSITPIIDAQPEVSAVSPVLVAGSEVSTDSRSGTYAVVAVEPDNYAEVFITPANMIDGRWLTPDDTDAIVLGIGVAGNNATTESAYPASLRTVTVGDSVDVTLADGTASSFTVVGIYQNHFLTADARAFITRGAVAAIAPALASSVTQLYVRLDDRSTAESVAYSLASMKPSLTIESWDTQLQAINEQVKSFDLIKRILRVVSLFIAAIAVMIVTYVDLSGKRRTIGIERAIGIRSGAIVSNYAIKAVAFAIIGVSLGIGLIFGVVLPINRAKPFPFPNGDVVLAVNNRQLGADAVRMIIVAVIAALVPSIKFVRTRILDAIWG